MHRQAAVAHPFLEFGGGAVSQPTGHESVIRPGDVEGITGLKISLDAVDPGGKQ